MRIRGASAGGGAWYRRGVFLLLGGVLVLPYLALVWIFAVLLGDSPAPLPVVLLLLAVTLVIGITPAFLGPLRSLEIVAVRLLLDVDLTEPPPKAMLPAESRVRAALWFALHATIGGLLLAAVVLAVPWGLAAIFQQADLDFGVPLSGLWEALAGVLLLVVLGLAVLVLSRLAEVMAPMLLGPSQAEKIEQLQAQARRLAERNRLARDLHDSMGHALTVTVLQAGAAREVLDADPEFARRALRAIEDTGREAMDQLDHALSVIRGLENEEQQQRPTLAQVQDLVDTARQGGLQVDVRVDGPISVVPRKVSREGYRIVQEALTNAARHAGPGPAQMMVRVAEGWLLIEVSNPVADRPSSRHGGRGLLGMRERVGLLGGQMTAGGTDQRWTVSVRLPIDLPIDKGVD